MPKKNVSSSFVVIIFFALFATMGYIIHYGIQLEDVLLIF